MLSVEVRVRDGQIIKYTVTVIRLQIIKYTVTVIRLIGKRSKFRSCKGSGTYGLTERDDVARPFTDDQPLDDDQRISGLVARVRLQDLTGRANPIGWNIKRRNVVNLYVRLDAGYLSGRNRVG